MTENQLARQHGIPRWLRRYHARYAKGGIAAIVACHLQNPAEKLDNARDRAAKRMSRREGMAPGCNPEDGTSRVGSIPTPSTDA